MVLVFCFRLPLISYVLSHPHSCFLLFSLPVGPYCYLGLVEVISYMCPLFPYPAFLTFSMSYPLPSAFFVPGGRWRCPPNTNGRTFFGQNGPNQYRNISCCWTFLLSSLFFAWVWLRFSRRSLPSARPPPVSHLLTLLILTWCPF